MSRWVNLSTQLSNFRQLKIYATSGELFSVRSRLEIRLSRYWLTLIKLVSVCWKDPSIQFLQYPLPRGNSAWGKLCSSAMWSRYSCRLPCTLGFLVLFQFTISRSFQVRFFATLGNRCEIFVDAKMRRKLTQPLGTQSLLWISQHDSQNNECTHLQSIILPLLCLGL